MSDAFYCPVDSCEKHHEHWTDDDEAPFSSQKGVRMHIYAKSDEDHQEAEDSGVWTDAEPNPLEEIDDGQDESDDGDDKPETDDSDDDTENMVSPEEYEQQQNGDDDANADDDQDDQDDQNPSDDSSTTSGAGSSGLVPKVSTPDIPPMYAFVIVAGIFTAIVIWRVYRARSSTGYTETVEDDQDEQVNTGNPPLLE